MAVTSSSFTLEHAQADGSRYCREVHTVTGGETVEIYYLAAPEADHAAIMTARVPSLNLMLAEMEALANIERDGAQTLLHITGAQFASWFRERIRDASQVESCKLAWWLIRRIAAGHITDAQCRTAWGLTTTQWNNQKARLQARHDVWLSVLAAAGD